MSAAAASGAEGLGALLAATAASGANWGGGVYGQGGDALDEGGEFDSVFDLRNLVAEAPRA
jgi:hypothetical protein